MIVYRTADNGRVTDLKFCRSDYLPKLDETMIEGDSLPDIDTLHTKDYKDAQALLHYRVDRRNAYGSIQDQLDMQYWDSENGTTTWKDAIDAIKAKYPKPQ
jgi:hypothetical protein